MQMKPEAGSAGPSAAAWRVPNCGIAGQSSLARAPSESAIGKELGMPPWLEYSHVWTQTGGHPREQAYVQGQENQGV
jgi:hypothetical protein